MERETKDIDLYQITEQPPSLRKAILDLRRDFDSHNHDGSSSRTFQTLLAETISANTLTIRKTSYTDTKSGLWAGIIGGVMKLNLGDSANYLKWDGANLDLSGYVVKSRGAFGGDGSDGALSISSGTTTLDLGAADTFTKNYSSISITGTGKLAFTNPGNNGTMIFIKCKGDMTVTSSTSPAIDASAMGSAAGYQGNGILSNTNYGVAGTAGANGPVQGTGGAGGAAITDSIFDGLKFYKLWCGAAGAEGTNGPISGVKGAAGKGGASLVIECAGAYNVTSTFSVAGEAGGNGTVGGTTNAGYGNSGGGGGGGFVTVGTAGADGSGTHGNKGSGGGGGSGGTLIVLYNTLTLNNGTYTVSGGAGGNGASDVNGAAGNGGAGGNGYSLVKQNTFFA